MTATSLSYLCSGATFKACINGESQARSLKVVRDGNVWWVMDHAWHVFPASLITISTIQDVVLPELV